MSAAGAIPLLVGLIVSLSSDFSNQIVVLKALTELVTNSDERSFKAETAGVVAAILPLLTPQSDAEVRIWALRLLATLECRPHINLTDWSGVIPNLVAMLLVLMSQQVMKVLQCLATATMLRLMSNPRDRVVQSL